MILFRCPRVVFGGLGALPAQIPAAGAAPSPLANDFGATEVDTEFIWGLSGPLIDLTSGGTTTVSDVGLYVHDGATVAGTYQQAYWLVKWAAGSDPANSVGSITMEVQSVDTAPTITQQPQAVTVTAGSPATFSVTATGTAPLIYQWSKGGVAIAGATSATYTISSAVSGDAGSYSVVVSNSAGTANSNAATLTVNAGSGGAAWTASSGTATLLAPVDQITDIGGFPAKPPEAVRVLAFEFKRYMAAVLPPVSVAIVHEGGAPDASAVQVLLGAPEISGTRVLQRVQGGVAHARYRVTCAATDSLGTTAVLSGVLPVLPAR